MEHPCRSVRLLMAIACAIACTALAIGARTAAAQDVTTVVEAQNAGVLGTYVEADDVRGVDDGQGIQFSMAWELSDVVQLQLATSYINFDTGVPATDFYRSSAGLELVRYFNPRGFAPFIVAGVGEGEMTSGTFSPTLERSIGLSRVPAQTADRCEVEIRGRLIAARVVRPPFVRNGKAAIAL